MAETKPERQQPQPAPTSAPNRREHDRSIANLRSSLTTLVILHHAACAYGGIGRVGYQSQFHRQGASTALVGFNAVNQSFFMGAFMFLGGHFSRRAIARKTTAQFVRDRGWRLGLPTVLYTLLGPPLCRAAMQLLSGGKVTTSLLWDYWKSLRGIQGPVWFTATLLVFDLVLVGVIRIKESLGIPCRVGSSILPTDGKIKHTLGAVQLYTTLGLCSVVDFAFRLRYPVGSCVPPLNLQPAYVSQYIAAYVFGVYTEDVTMAMPSIIATAGLVVVSGVASAFMWRILGASRGTNAWQGGWNQDAAWYALWNNVSGFLVARSLFTVFERHLNGDWVIVNDLAYPAFLMHMPVMTTIGQGLDSWEARSVVKTAVVGTASIAGSFMVGLVLNRLFRVR